METRRRGAPEIDPERPEAATEGGAAGRLQLLDWKERVFALYQSVRASRDPAAAWAAWCAAREGLFRNHSQSPVPEAERARYTGSYFAYDPGARVLADVVDVPPACLLVAASDGGTYRFIRFAEARFHLFRVPCSLALYWLEGYGGGLFLPFRDRTSGAQTYGAGRYLLDTVKGADLGFENGRLVLDFNFAYNPSCAYDPRWSCPLAPPDNRLAVAVPAGERIPAISLEEATDA
ncbi:MAG TPA: DUF1684 domain-containing protein [bacterium]|nr:DUF1684 domain-containing protein [bacterium]